MRLLLDNVGKIAKADIEINGITVIAGENNTGKSTIGKILYCIFDSFYCIEDQIFKERKISINRVINNYYHETTDRLTRRFDASNIAAYIVEQKDLYLKNSNLLEKELENFYMQSDENFTKYISKNALESTVSKIRDYLEITDDEIRKVILRKRLLAEFNMKIGHVNFIDIISHILLEIKDKKIEINIKSNDEIMINSYISLVKELVYIDDPFILDDLNAKVFKFINPYNSLDHRHNLLLKLGENGNKENEFSVLDEISVNKKLDKIMNAINDVCDGDLLSNDEHSIYVYKTNKLKEALDISNLSTGMKNFVIIRTLLKNGSINDNGIIVLDEPEIHLHPEWQLKFAEIIVLIQKEFGANILLNTHSPYFLNAIEVYSNKHQISKKCKYYMTEEIEGRANILDVSNNIEKIYEKLSRSLQELESLEYRDDKCK